MNDDHKSGQDEAIQTTTAHDTGGDASATADEGARFAAYRERIRGSVSHDLRSPLSAILVACDILRGSAPDSTTEMVLQRIVSCTDRTLAMLASLVDYTDEYLGDGISIDPVTHDVATIARNSVETYRRRHPTRVLQRDGADEAVLARVDTARVAQAIGHLLDNALTHGSADEPVRVSVSSTADDIIVEVRNRGDAIPADTLARLFEPFERAAKQATGLGLGLYIVRAIARAHSGTAELFSSAAGETVARLTLARDLSAP